MILRRGNILVVDDHAINRELIRNVLEREHDVFVASSVAEARIIVADQAIDLILLDIMMPDVNGLDWLQELRAHDASARLPIILVTALSDTRDIVRGLELGANDYLPKPLDMRVLMARVQTQLSLKYLLDEREQMIEHLQEAQQLRANLFRIVSHDLKNPLHNIRLAEHLLRGQGVDEKYHMALNTINSTVDAMQQVVDDFLEVVELESGKTRLHIQKVRLDDVLNDVVAQYEVSANAKHIQIDMPCRAGVVAYADYHRLRQALSNLVSNAIKYSPFHTRVRVTVRDNEDGVYISVHDQGPGIAPHERNKLFEEFATTSNRPTNNESSTGLGLWIVAHLMRLQNGSCGVDFPDEGGAVFWLGLPHHAPDAEA